MGTVTVGRDSAPPVDPHSADDGGGSAVVLPHGWPVDSRSWEPRLPGRA